MGFPSMATSATIGITDYRGKHELGDVVFVELPKARAPRWRPANPLAPWNPSKQSAKFTLQPAAKSSRPILSCITTPEKLNTPNPAQFRVAHQDQAGEPLPTSNALMGRPRLRRLHCGQGGHRLNALSPPKVRPRGGTWLASIGAKIH